jgi:hypothetical protein
MIQSKLKRKQQLTLLSGHVNEPYVIINLFFAGVIFLILAYSALYSPDRNNYPVVCLHEAVTGQPCLSCGLSHSFSLIVRGRIGEAAIWNQYGIRLFIFFIAQLILRLAFSADYIKHRNIRRDLIIIDSAGSGILFVMAFLPFLVNIFTGFIHLFS